MNRRGFFRGLFGAALAPLAAKVLPAQTRSLWINSPETLSMEEFTLRYLQPAVVSLANQIDMGVAMECQRAYNSQLSMARESVKCGHFTIVGRVPIKFDPARLPA